MKKVNSRGFILAETLIVTIFVLGIFVMIYRNSIPLIQEYMKLENYDDVNSIYAVNLIKDIIYKDVSYQSILTEVDKNGYKDISECSNFSNKDLCNVIKNDLGITNEYKIIVTKFDPSYIKAVIDNKTYLSGDGNRGIKDYINYIINTYNIDDKETYDYRVIISRSVDNTTKYANIGVKLS